MIVEHYNHILLQCTKAYQSAVYEHARAAAWPALEKQTIAEHNYCACCGGKTKLQVHHCNPFHLFPERELDPTNLIVLCMAIGFECHYDIGHVDENGYHSWKVFNPHVKIQAAMRLKERRKK